MVVDTAADNKLDLFISDLPLIEFIHGHQLAFSVEDAPLGPLLAVGVQGLSLALIQK
jgi:hypothetical protein